MQMIRNSNPPAITRICDRNKSRAWHHCSLKHGSKLKYLNLSMLSRVMVFRTLFTWSLLSLIGFSVSSFIFNFSEALLIRDDKYRNLILTMILRACHSLKRKSFSNENLFQMSVSRMSILICPFLKIGEKNVFSWG